MLLIASRGPSTVIDQHEPVVVEPPAEAREQHQMVIS